MAVLHRVEKRRSRVWADRHNVHTERLAKRQEPFEELRRFQRFHDRRDFDAMRASKPEGGPFPTPEVWENEERPHPSLDRRENVFESGVVEAVVHRGRIEIRKSETVEVVAPVCGEAFGYGSFERRIVDMPGTRTPNVSLNDHSPVTREERSKTSSDIRGSPAESCRHMPSAECGRLVQSRGVRAQFHR